MLNSCFFIHFSPTCTYFSVVMLYWMPYVKPCETSLCLKGVIQINLPLLAKSSASLGNINRVYKRLWAEIIAAIKADLGSGNTKTSVL